MKTHHVLARMALARLQAGDKAKARRLWEESKRALRKSEGWV